jgi:hypothetical protein
MTAGVRRDLGCLQGNRRYDWLRREGLVPGWLGGGSSAPAAPKVAPQSEKHSSLVPPAAQVPVNFTANINLDGRKVASVVTDHMVASATYPTSAAGADSRGTWMGPSWNPTEMG